MSKKLQPGDEVVVEYIEGMVAQSWEGITGVALARLADLTDEEKAGYPDWAFDLYDDPWDFLYEDPFGIACNAICEGVCLRPL